MRFCFNFIVLRKKKENLPFVNVSSRDSAIMKQSEKGGELTNQWPVQNYNNSFRPVAPFFFS